jgi:hypothetical protein
MNMAETSREQASRPRRPGRTVATIRSLDQLLGAHPHALHDVYASGIPADPCRLGERRGRLLNLEHVVPAHAATRPLVVAIAKHLSPWQGKAFESGGTAGRDLVFGRALFRFHSEVAASSLDGQPTLVLRYDGLDNPWPVSRIVDELRGVGEGIAIGPAFWRAPSGRVDLLCWWGLETAD